MTFKESIAYGKDLITGRSIEKVKKKLIMPVTGVATVKLYDDLTHKQIYEAKSENRISAVFANIAFLEEYYYPMLDNEHKGLERNIFTTNPFRVMTLTTGDMPEDPYDYWTWGSVIGYADGWYEYSGSDKFRGTINKAEWSRSNNTKHFVFDFPTHAANGTFRSIYWSGGSNDRDDSQGPNINDTYVKRVIEDGNKVGSLPNYNICTDKQNIYLLKTLSKITKVYDKTTNAKKNDINLSVEAKAITFDGVDFWILIEDGSFKRLDKNFNVIQSYNKSPSIPDNLIYDVYYYDIAVDENNIYITYSGSVKSSDSKDYRSCIAVYNKDGTFNKKAEIYSGTSNCVHLTLISNEKLWVIIKSNVCIQLNNDLSIYGMTSLTSTGYRSIHWDKDTQTIFTYYDFGNSVVHEKYIVPASAHTLLPETITKMPTNTMKIQYDFTCDYVNPLDMPAH